MKLVALLLTLFVQDSDEGKKIDRAIQRSTGGGFWGAVLVARAGKPILEKGYGFADYEDRRNMPDTLFEIASTSKQFTAAAVLKLDMEGKLDLSDSIAKHFKGVPEDKKGITVRHLITHTSGLDQRVGVGYGSEMTRAEYIAHVMKSKRTDEIGEKFAYNNGAYALLAALVEEVSGKSFEAYSEEKLFGPAGMTDTGFINDKNLDRKRQSVRHSDRLPGTAADWFWGWGYRGMGGVVSTVRDLLKWDQALRGDGIFDKETRKKLYTVDKQSYACGWRVTHTPRNTRIASHSGGVPGFRAHFVRYLEENVTIIILTNESGNIFEVEKTVRGILFPRPKLEADLDWTGQKLGKWNVLQTRSRAWKVTAGEKTVRLSPSGEAEIRVPVARLKTLAESLDGFIKEKKDDGAKEPEMEFGLYLAGYTLNGARMSLTEKLRIRLTPQYRSNAGVDDRITFVLVDEKIGQWPVMVKMNLAAAKALSAELRKALK